MTLWFLSTGADYRTVGHLFGVSKSTVCIVTKHAIASIVELLLPEYIRMPTGTALREVVEGFKRDHGFPQCAGVIDGSHIPIVSRALPTTSIGKAGIQSSCRGQWMIGVDSQTFMLDGLVECMMPVCLPTPACIAGHRATPFSRAPQNALLVGTFHSCSWAIQCIHFCSG